MTNENQSRKFKVSYKGANVCVGSSNLRSGGFFFLKEDEKSTILWEFILVLVPRSDRL